MKINTYCLLAVFTITLYSDALRAKTVSPKKADRPNIVLMFVDDMGWSDLEFRNDVFESPNIAELVNDGLSFNSAYIPTPTCSPSRAALLTGKHPARLKMVRHIPNSTKYGFDRFGRIDKLTHLWPGDPAKFPSVNWLDLSHLTYAEALKGLGYYNYFIGKWHLGHEPYHPTKQGFDEQYATTNWGHPRSYKAPFFKNTPVLSEIKDGYLTDVLTDNAVNFINNYDKNSPFMLSLWYYNVHSPFVGKDEYVQRFKQKGLTEKYAHYAAMVKSVDDSVGRVRVALKKKNIAKNTVIIFLSDQGGAFDNRPFHGGKKMDTLYEGGARVPLVIHWPGNTKAGSQNESLVQSIDLFPTIVEIAGGKASNYHDLDGISLSETIKHNELLMRDEPLYGYRAYEDLYMSVRDNEWKLLAYRSGKIKLFNIVRDVGEQADLSKSHHNIVKRLQQKAIAWEEKMGVVQYSGLR